MAGVCIPWDVLKAGLAANKSGFGLDISKTGVDIRAGVEEGVLGLPHWDQDTGNISLVGATAFSLYTADSDAGCW